jgi:hypothetical protein
MRSGSSKMSQPGNVLENTPLVEQYGVGGDVAFSLVNPDVSQSLQRDKGILRVGIVTYDANGTYLNTFKAVDPYESGTGAPEVEYRWYAPEGRWVLMSLSFGGRA